MGALFALVATLKMLVILTGLAGPLDPVVDFVDAGFDGAWFASAVKIIQIHMEGSI